VIIPQNPVGGFLKIGSFYFARIPSRNFKNIAFLKKVPYNGTYRRKPT